MKTKYFKGIMALSFGATMFLSSCLKDARNFDPESVTSNVAELPLSGMANFSKDAVTKAGIDTITFAVGVTSANPPTSPTTITIGVDNGIITTYNTANPAIVYQSIPTAAYKLAATAITIPAGQNSTTTKVIIDRTQLDPAASYMLPIKIVNAGGITISANFGIHYYHIIGNDFAGTYTYQYKRFQNGTGPGAGAIPSKGEGSPPDITNPVGSTTVLSPISPTEFKMVTNYNGQGVMYDVTFTRTVGSGGIINYSNWAVTFLADDLAKWTGAGITNMVPPKFTIPPPTTSNSPKVFELNYVSGGASGRYIDDTYSK